MAKEIFISTNTGKLVKIKNESTGNTPALIQMGTKTGGVKSTNKSTFPALITSFSIQLETMHTFARSLSDVFYVYPFGDKPTEITVACLVMSDGECDNGVLSYSDTLAQLVDFYKSNRISNKNKLSIIEVVVGSQALKINGLITRMSIVGQMPAGIPALQVTFNLIGWLEDISGGGSNSATSAGSSGIDTSGTGTSVGGSSGWESTSTIVDNPTGLPISPKPPGYMSFNDFLKSQGIFYKTAPTAPAKRTTIQAVTPSR